MSTTYAAGRLQLLQELFSYPDGFQIPNAYVDAFASGSLTSAFFLRDSNKDGNYYNKKMAGAFRPATATAADAYRVLNLLTNSSGLITHTGANYTDVTVGTETVEIWPWGIRPDTDVLNACNRSLQDIYFPAYEPFSIALDSAERETGTSSWGTPSSASAAKQTTATRVYPGFIRSTAVTNSGANGYQPTANIGVTPLEPIYVANFGRLHSGTAAQQTLYDVTNGAVFGSTVTHSNQTFQFMWQRTNVPSGCYNINVRRGGSGASDVTDWCGTWVYRPNAGNVVSLPTYTDEIFKFGALCYSDFYTGSTSSGVYEGLSMDMTEISPSDYGSSFTGPAANPNWIQLHRAASGWYNYPLWMQIRLQYAERGTLSAESDTTTAPLHLWLPAWKRRLLESPSMRARVQDGNEIYATALAVVDAHARQRAQNGPQKRRADTGYRTMAN